MIDNFKPLGAFVENTVRPLLEESKELIKDINKAGLPLTEDNLTKFFKGVVNVHLKTMFYQFLTTLVISGVVIYFIWMTSQE